MTQILNGKYVAALREQQLTATLQERLMHPMPEGIGKKPPQLAVILVGDDPASQVYVARKREACARVGILSQHIQLPANTPIQTLLERIQTLNQDPDVHGILIQLPLPIHLEVNTVVEAIDPIKDVDGFHPYHLGRLLQQRPLLRPCTPKGIISLLEHYAIPLAGLHAVVIGISNIVGKPMALELLAQKCTVTQAHRATRDLPSLARSADLLVVATGSPHLVQADWVKPGAIVIDVGIHRLNNGHLIGDVNFEHVHEKTSWITPVPGGVGPMTIISLLENTVEAARLQADRRNHCSERN